MDRSKLHGLIAAIVTPMQEDFSVDETSLRRYVRWLSEQGITGVAVNVDTGEGPHLSAEERVRVIDVVAEEVGDRTAIVAGLVGSHTAQAARLAADLATAGADALLVFPLAVYQGEPLDPEIPAAYHRAVHESSGLPLIAFQLQPALGGVNFAPSVLERLVAVPGVVAIKEASFDAKRFLETVRAVRAAAPDVVLLNGNDNFLLEAYLLGAEGALLGFGTIGAHEQVVMFDHVRAGNMDRARRLADVLQPLSDAIFDAPVRDYRARIKHLLSTLGVIDHAYVRPPLLPLPPEEAARIERAWKEASLA
jgi:4-hydroxy-tetrahydrodipicolinate synthase